MSLVTSSHQSGENVQVSFDKEALKLISKVANHPLLSDEANWEMVTIVYKHESSSKRLVSGIKNNFSKTDDVRVKSDMSGGEVYELYKILISGQDRTPIVSISRDEITNASSMDLTLATGGSGTPAGLYAIWNSFMGGYSYTNNLNVSNSATVESDGGIFGGHPADWIIASNTNFAPSESGTFIYEVGNELIDNIAFGLNFADYSNIGFIFLNGKLRVNVDGDVPSQYFTDLSPTGTNICKIEKVGNTQIKFYLNNALLHTVSLQNQWSWGSYAFQASVRPSGSSSSNGILAAYKVV